MTIRLLIAATLYLLSPLIFANTQFNSTDWTIEKFSLNSTILSDNKTDLDTHREVMVWLPPSYKLGDRRYPVIHYLHNANWSNRQMAEEERIQDTFARAVERGLIQDFIFVVGDYTTTHGAGTFFGNNSVAGRWHEHIVKELVPEIDARYRTLKNKNSRAISGDFFGGHGALSIAMNHPEVFSSVYALHPVGTGTGDRLTGNYADWELLNSAKSYADVQGTSGYNDAFLMMAQSFAPNLNKPPFYVDWITEPQGDQLVTNTQHLKNLRNNFSLTRVVESHIDNLKSLKAIGFDWGRYDANEAHILGCRQLTRQLTSLGIKHIAEEFNGGPWSEKWVPNGRVENDMLPFFQRNLNFR
ncbi:alpha/beta hydrolase family protein [Arenicella sp. 4NH20-0111]|uniref:alpha/beta hydrolase n=1 Tax=Arenicella sp. 4NH20-0111 TaxID=3127648 RepID=UPI003105AD88